MTAGPARVLRGIVFLARGRADGFADIEDSVGGFMNSLAPLVAFPLVATALMLIDGAGAAALSDLLATICALLAPSVLSHPLARLWGRDTRWLRFAIAFNWCQWAIPVALMALLIAAGLLMAAGVPSEAAGLLALFALIAYALWLHWFLARRGLQLGPWQAVAMVVCINLGTGILVAGPVLLAQMLADAVAPGDVITGGFAHGG